MEIMGVYKGLLTHHFKILKNLWGEGVKNPEQEEMYDTPCEMVVHDRFSLNIDIMT